MAPQTRPTASTLITALLLALSAVLGAQAACYYPNGIDRNAEEESDPYRPCTSTDSSSSLSSTSNETEEEASMCCRTRDWDDCRSDGLCQVNNITWRESCTDKTWKAKGCVKLCVDGSLANKDVPVMQCADESWCCADDGSNPADCCSRGQGKWIDDEKQVVTTRPTGLVAVSTVAVAESKPFTTGATSQERFGI
ncbi:hypothetical protein DBV05_g10969 [Lasiodiplodia theobromae]|uniref:Uncharacterized protein n=1 Tax=Lasiodiplodia theobromae TaxID=45133 RepID=A0A5N5CYB8_9PEZI|nr:hypothetical protein DBV05_g10969 [Lasiodiplodia theobromae]